jgi:hypothetical protein
MPKTVNLTTISSDIKRSIAKGTLEADAQNIQQEILESIQAKLKPELETKVQEQLEQLKISYEPLNKLNEEQSILKNNLEELQKSLVVLEADKTQKEKNEQIDKLSGELKAFEEKNPQLTNQLQLISSQSVPLNALQQFLQSDNPPIDLINDFISHQNLFDGKNELKGYLASAMRLYSILNNPAESDHVLKEIKLFDDTQESPYLSYGVQQEENKVFVEGYLKSLNIDSSKKSSITARIAFLKHLNTLSVDRETGTEKTMTELLGKEGLKLYEAALKEEIASSEFQTAYVNQSISTYSGQRPQKNWDVLVLSGVSGAGKTSTGHYQISQMYPSDKSDKQQNSKFNLVWIDGGIPRELSRMQLAIKRFIEAHGCNVTDLYKQSAPLNVIKEKLQQYVFSNPDKVDGVVIPETFSGNLLLDATTKKFKKKFEELNEQLKEKKSKKKLIVSTALVTGEDNTKFEQTNLLMIQSRATMNEQQKNRNFEARGSKIGLLDDTEEDIKKDFLGDSHKEYKENTSVLISSYGLGMAGSQSFMLGMMDKTSGHQVFILNDLRRYAKNLDPKKLEVTVNGTAPNTFIASKRVYDIWDLEGGDKLDFKEFADASRTIFGNFAEQANNLIHKFSTETTPGNKTYQIIMKHYRKEIIKDRLAELSLTCESTDENFVDEVFQSICDENGKQNEEDIGTENRNYQVFSNYMSSKNLKLSFPNDEEVFNYARKRLASHLVRVDQNSAAACYPFYVSLYQQFKHVTKHEDSILRGQNVEKLRSANQPYLLDLFRVLNETNPGNHYSCTKALNRINKILEEKNPNSKTAATKAKGKTIKILELAREYFERRIESFQKNSIVSSNFLSQGADELSNLNDLMQTKSSNNQELKRILEEYKASQSETDKYKALKSWLEAYESEGNSDFYDELNPSANKEINQLFVADPLNITLNKVLMKMDGEFYGPILDKYFDFLDAKTITEKNTKFKAVVLEMMTPRDSSWFKASFDNTGTIKKLRRKLGDQSYLIDELMDKTLDYPMLKIIHELRSGVERNSLQSYYEQFNQNPTEGLTKFVEKLKSLGKEQEFFNQLSDQQKILFHCQMGSNFVKELVQQEVDEKILATVCQTSTISPAMRYEVLKKLEHSFKGKDKKLESLQAAHTEDLANEFEEFKEFKEFKEQDKKQARTWVLEKTKDDQWAKKGKSLKNLAKAMSYLPNEEAGVDETTVFVKNMLENISLYQLYDNADMKTDALDKSCQNPSGVKSIQLMSTLQLHKDEPICSVSSVERSDSKVAVYGETKIEQKSTLNPVVLDKPIKVKKGEDGIVFTIEQPPKTSNIKVSCTKKDFETAQGNANGQFEPFKPEQVDVMVTMVQTLLLNWKKGKMIQLNVENDPQARAMYYTCMLLSDKLKSWDKDRFGSFDMNSVIIRQGGKVHNLSKAKEDIEKHQKRFFKTEIGELTKIQQSFEGTHESEMKTAYQSMLTREDEKMIKQFDDEVQKLISSMETMPEKKREALYKETFFKYKQKHQDLSERALNKLETHMKGSIKGG